MDMNQPEEIFEKLGLAVSATALASTGLSQAAEIIQNKNEEFPLTAEQKKFMAGYEKWLKEFHDMQSSEKRC